jgi:hypothetical protein
MQFPRLVVIESPFAGEVALNVEYARAALSDSLRRGEAPFASHLLYTQVLDDLVPVQREQGIAAGFAWGQAAELHAFYVDRGISRGMRIALGRVLDQRARLAFEFRSLHGDERALEAARAVLAELQS